jgi:surface antigen
MQRQSSSGLPTPASAHIAAAMDPVLLAAAVAAASGGQADPAALAAAVAAAAAASSGAPSPLALLSALQGAAVGQDGGSSKAGSKADKYREKRAARASSGGRPVSPPATLGGAAGYVTAASPLQAALAEIRLARQAAAAAAGGGVAAMDV